MEKLNGIAFSNLTQDQEDTLKALEQEFQKKTGKNLYLLAFDKQN